MEHEPDSVKYARILPEFKKLRAKYDELKENHKLTAQQIMDKQNSILELQFQVNNLQLENKHLISEVHSLKLGFKPLFDEKTLSSTKQRSKSDFFECLFPITMSIDHIEEVFSNKQDFEIDLEYPLIDYCFRERDTKKLAQSVDDLLELPPNLNETVRKIIHKLEQKNNSLTFRLQSEKQHRVLESKKYEKMLLKHNGKVEYSDASNDVNMNMNQYESLRLIANSTKISVIQIYEDKLTKFMRNSQIYAANNSLLMNELDSLFKQNVAFRRDVVQTETEYSCAKDKLECITDTSRRQITDLAIHVNELTEEIEYLRSQQQFNANSRKLSNVGDSSSSVRKSFGRSSFFSRPTL